jgi:acetyl esterase/lipase
MNDLRDLPFLPHELPQLTLDVRYPAGQPPFPAVVWISGGGWAMMGKRGAERAAWILGHGFALVPITYRVSSIAPFPAAARDCADAVRWLKSHAAELGLDARRFAAWGDSAGGHLALLLATAPDLPAFRAWNDGSPSLAAAVSYMGPTDLTRLDSVEDDLDRFLGGPGRRQGELARLASPLAHVHAGQPPLFMAHGEADRLVRIEQMEWMRSACDAVGCRAASLRLPGVAHDSETLYAHAGCRAATLDFLRTELG